MLKNLFSSEPKRVEPADAEKREEPTPSLALKEFIARLEEFPKPHVLDLGWACGTNIDFFGHRGCKIFIEDLYNTLVPLLPQPEAAETFDYAALFREVLPHPLDSMDGVLTWDLFNYLPVEVLQPLNQRLFELCRSGGVLFSLLSSSKEVPAAPTLYRVADEHHLLYEKQSEMQQNIRPLSNNDMMRAVAPFSVLNSYFLRNGVREVLFIRR